MNGGTFTSANGSGIQTYAQAGHEGAILKNFVKGGKFSSELKAEMIAEGYTQKLVDGMYVVSAV